MARRTPPKTRSSKQPTKTTTTSRRRRGLKSSKTKRKELFDFTLTSTNFIILGVGLGVILLGFVLMSLGITEKPAVPDGKWNNIWSVSVAPILLVLGYCVLIPYGLLKTFKADTVESEKS